MGHVNTEISLRCSSEEVQEGDAYQSLGRGPSWKCPQKIAEVLSMITFITWTLAGSNQESIHSLLNSDCWEKKITTRGAWVAQLVECPTSAQVMISQLMSLSPISGSVLTAQSLEPASDSVSPSLSTLQAEDLSLSGRLGGSVS